MTPHRDQKRGTFIIDRRFRRIGRIKRASGTSDRHTFAAIARPRTGMLDQLYQTGRLDLLEAIRDGVLVAAEVYARWVRSELQLLPTATELIPLETFRSWAERAPTGEDNRASRLLAAQYLAGLAGRDATIAALPNLVRAFRAACEHLKHRTFNLVRVHVERFLAERVGRAHRLYVAVAAVPTLPVRRRAGRPLSVREFLDGVTQLERAYAEIAWALALTGMGRKEYWYGRWTERLDRIEIHGTKRRARERVIPRMQAIARPTRLYPAFRRAMSRAFDGRTPRDLRRTFARWLQEAEIPRTRRRLYLGHGAQDVSDLYEEYQISEFVRQDGRSLADLLHRGRRAARTA